VTARLLRVCVTGPESTGKTTLARRLAEWTGPAAEWVPEAARQYAERRGGELIAADVGPIAEEHIALADAAAERLSGTQYAQPLLVLDTDLMSTLIYAWHYYGAAPSWVDRDERARRADLYLLCDVDVPWVPDGVRDRPTDRVQMFEQFRDTLTRRGAVVRVVCGDWDARWSLARDAVAGLMV
jgi:HTH-type transcriptional regulator, transcriptional repressor of NAD biosynthesis genes